MTTGAARHRALVPEGRSRPVGRYSPGIEVAMLPGTRLVYVSGQVATDHEGRVLAQGDAGGQTEIVFDRIRQVLRTAGGTLDDLVNLAVYLVDVRGDFAAVSGVRNRILGEPAPASALVEVSRLVEEGCLVEISAVAVVRGEAGRAQ